MCVEIDEFSQSQRDELCKMITGWTCWTISY